MGAGGVDGEAPAACDEFNCFAAGDLDEMAQPSLRVRCLFKIGELIHYNGRVIY